MHAPCTHTAAAERIKDNRPPPIQSVASAGEVGYSCVFCVHFQKLRFVSTFRTMCVAATVGLVNARMSRVINLYGVYTMKLA